MKSFTGVGYTIYKHTNRVNGKCYIGQTKSEDLTRRWTGGNGYKECRYFYNAILKYGWKSFAHEILETGLSAAEANDREQFYIALYRSNEPEFGYNIRKGGQENTTFSEEGLRHISECSTGANNGNARRVSVFNLEGKRIAVVETAKEAAQLIGVAMSTLSRHLNHRRGTCGGHIARWEDEVHGITQLAEEQKFFPNEQRSLLRPVGQYNMEGNLLAVFKSRKDASKTSRVPCPQISACCIGLQKSAGGYMWRDFKEGKGKVEPFFREQSDYTKSLARPVSCYSPETGELIGTYPSIVKAGKAHSISGATIGNSIRGGWKAAGFHWKYADENKP